MPKCTTKKSSDQCRQFKAAEDGFRKLKRKSKQNKFTSETVEPIAKEIRKFLEEMLREDREGEGFFDFDLVGRDQHQQLLRSIDSLERDIRHFEKVEKEDKEYINTLEKKIKRLEEEKTQLKEVNESDKNRCKSLESELNSHKESITKLTEEIESHVTKISQMKEDNEREKKEYEKTLNENLKEIQRLCDDLALQTGERESLEEECKKKEKNIADIQMANKELIAAKERLTKEMKATQSTVQRLEKEKKELEDHIQKMTNEIESQAVEIQHFARAYENQRTDNYNLTVQINQTSRSLEEQRRTIDKLQKTLSEEKKAKENALNRLSAAAANRLRDQNPGITDLSDPNRPLKLAEKVSELYDNEWTNAMENLESDLNIPEEKGIRILLKIIKNVFDTCTEFGDNHLQSFPDMLILPPSFIKTDQERMLNVKDLPPEMLKPMKDFRKSHAKHAINRLQKFLSTDEGISKLKIKKKVVKPCEEYIKKCIELCWMMRIQDPPIYMETGYPTNSQFDSNKMRSYTKAGKFIHFVVWPTFFLHKDGPLLAKGVVQGSKTEIKDGKEINGDEECSSSNSESDGEEYGDARSRTDSQPNDNVKETTSQDDDEDIPTSAQHPNQQGNTETIQEADGTSIDVTKDKPEGANETEDEPEGPNGETHISQSTLSRSEATDQQKEANSDKTKEENMNGREMTTEKTDASNDETQNDN